MKLWKKSNLGRKAFSQTTKFKLAAAAQFAVEPLESRRLLSASIGGTVYNDANGNHVRDGGEVAVVGQQVYLDLQGISQFVAGDPVSTTDAAGAYNFTGLAAGNYLVRPVPVAGKVTTTPIYGGKFFVQLAANQNVTGDDFGIQSAGTPNFNMNGQLLISGATNGQATLTRYNLVDGSTDVTFGSLGVVTLPNTVTGVPTGAVAQGANAVITYPTQIVTLNGTGGVVSITPTGVTGGASISGRVLVDTVSPLQISPVPGTQVYLDLQGIDTFVPGDPVSTADANGNYSFTGLTAGNYLVRLVPTSTRFTTTPVYGGKFYVQLGANQAVVGDDFKVRFEGTNFTFNVNGQFYVSALSPSTGTNTLTKYNADESRDVTFGNLGVVQLPVGYNGPPTSVVAGLNGNIVVTYPTLPASTIITLNSVGVVQTTVPNLNAPTGLTAIATSPTSVQLGFTDNSTNDNGFVIERATNAAGPFASVGSLSGTLTGPTLGFVGFADNSAQANTSYYYRVYAVGGGSQSAIAGPVSVTTPAVIAGGASISGTVFNDANNNGVQDGTELPVAGRQVYLDLQGIGVFANGDPITTTNAGGQYSFTGLAAANYLVRLIPQAGTVITAPVYGGKYYVPLAAKQVVTGDNFGTQSATDTVIHNVSLTLPNGQLLIARPQFIDISIQNSSVASILTRYNSDGSTDVTYGSAGSVAIPLMKNFSFVSSFPKGLLQLSNGNTLVVTEDGHLSNSNSDETQFAVVDPTGHVVRAVTVSSHSGSAGFSAGDFVDAYSVTPDGKILAAGHSTNVSFLAANSLPDTLVVWKFNADLTLDLTFGINGRADITNIVGAPTGVTGLVGGGVTVYYPNDSFNLSSTGQLQLDASRVIPIATGVTATAISASQVAVQFTDNATTEQFYDVEATYGGGGVWQVVGKVQGSAATGPRLFLVSNLPSNTAVQFRLRAINGTVQSDPSAVASATTLGTNTARVMLGDGKIVTSTNVLISPTRLVTYLTRSNANGSLDTSFGTGGQVEIGEVAPPSSNSYSVPQILVKPDGTLVVLSLNTYSASNTKGEIATLTAYDTNGKVIKSADVTSNIGVGSPHGPDVEQIALTGDGKVLIAGTNLVFGQTPYSFVARFNADFTPDSTFGTFTPDPTFGTPTKGLNLTNIGMMNPADGIAQLPDGNIIAAFGSNAVLLNNSGAIQPPGFNAPTNLTAVATANNKVHLQYMDNAVNETGFIIERKLTSSGLWARLFTPPVPASEGTGVMQFDDTTVSPSTSYDYRVFAVNGSLRTGYVGPVTVVTPA